MRSSRFVAFALVAAGFIGASTFCPANAYTVSIGLQQAGVDGDGAGVNCVVGGICTVAGPSSPAAGVIGLSYGTFTINNITANGPVGANTLLDSTSVNVSSSTGGTLYVYVTVQGITAPVGAAVPFLSSFTSNALDAGMTLDTATYLSAADGLYALTTLLGSASFVGPQLVATDVDLASVPTGAGPYSLTAVYQITSSGAGSSNATIAVSVPGPIVGAGLPGLLMACAGLVALARRRRSRAGMANA